MSDYIISIDAGNGLTNAVLAQKKGTYKSIHFPSVRAAASGDSLGLGSAFEMDTEWVEFGSHRYFVGDDAKLSRQPLERHQGAFRYGDEFHIFLITVAIGKLGIKSGSIDLTTFAPPGLYLEARKAIEKRLKQAGNKLSIQFKGDKEPRVFTIENLTVHPEGLGALLCFVMDKNGKAVDSNLLEGENVVLDLGMYTLDALQVSDGQFNPESLSSATWENGGIKAHILDPMLRAVKKQGGEDFSLITTDDVDRTIRHGLATGDYTLTVAGIEANIKPLLDKHRERYSAWIVNNIIDGVFNGMRGIKSLILVGGGATFVREWMNEYLGDDKLLNPDANKAAKGVDAIEMNAVGGLRLALSKQTA